MNLAPTWRVNAERIADHELTARGVIALGGLLLAGATWLHVTLTDRLGLFFSCCFVLTCLTTVLLVRSNGFFAVGVLPPLLMLGILAAVAVLAPTHIDAPGLADDAGLVPRVVAGLVGHAGGLVIGHAAVLGIIGARIRVGPPAAG